MVDRLLPRTNGRLHETSCLTVPCSSVLGRDKHVRCQCFVLCVPVKQSNIFFFRAMLTHVKYMNIPTGMTHSEGTASQKEERRGVGETLYNGSRYWDPHTFWVSVF